VHVGFAQQDSTGSLEPPHNLGVFGRNTILKYAAGGSRPDVRRIEQVDSVSITSKET